MRESQTGRSVAVGGLSILLLLVTVLVGAGRASPPQGAVRGTTASGAVQTADAAPASSEPATGAGENGTTEAGAAEDEFFDPFAHEDAGAQAALEEYDPWEPYNEVVFEFNYRLDKYLIKPVAQGYDFVVPNVVQRGIANAFHNVRFVPRMFNNVFQGKLKGAGLEVSRFLINTTVGLGGFFDPAKDWLELDTPDEDFGQTLGVYGVGPGPYVLIPFFAQPFTVRDAVGFVVDLGLDPFNYLVIPFQTVEDWPQVVQDDDTTLILNWGLRGLEVLNLRSLNLETFQGVEEAAVDLYGAVRNAYLQSRAKAIRE